MKFSDKTIKGDCLIKMTTWEGLTGFICQLGQNLLLGKSYAENPFEIKVHNPW
jgi:hypothetical protein